MTTNLNKTISASGLTVRTKLAFDGRDFISLTDIAKYHNSERPADVIKNWMRLRNTVEYLGLWEKVNNPDFKVVEFDHFKSEVEPYKDSVCAIFVYDVSDGNNKSLIFAYISPTKT